MPELAAWAAVRKPEIPPVSPVSPGEAAMPEPNAPRASTPPDLWEEARDLLGDWPLTMTYGPFPNPAGREPRFAVRGEGGSLYDETGTRYVDWAPGWGTQILGYRRPEIEEAIREQLTRGTCFTLMTEVEVEVARALREMVPCAERIVFGKHGSDPLGVAVRIARAVTGRELILCFGYHGFHDWFLAREACEGIPEALRGLVKELPFNDLEAVEELFRAHGERIAGVVLEAASGLLPAPGYLEGLRELTRAHGALLVFDEVVTAFRLARGGAQEAFGVIPDLACLGKAMANGMPLSALVGSAEYMDQLPRVGYDPTFRGETLSLAAARAGLEIHRTEPVVERISEMGEELRRGFEESLVGLNIECELSGHPARMTAIYRPAGGISPLGMKVFLMHGLLEHGVITTGTYLPCLGHTAEDVERTARGWRAVHEKLDRAIAEEDLLSYLDAPPHPLLFEGGVIPPRYRERS